MRACCLWLAFPLGLAAASPALAQTPRQIDDAAVAAACGGDARGEQFASLPPSERAARLACLIREAATRANATLPRSIDPITTLQRATADGARLTYDYRIERPASDIPPGALEGFLPSLRARVCGDSNQRAIVAAGGSWRYVYKDRTGGPIGELTIASCPD